jgi:hypothetical protein
MTTDTFFLILAAIALAANAIYLYVVLGRDRPRHSPTSHATDPDFVSPGARLSI